MDRIKIAFARFEPTLAEIRAVDAELHAKEAPHFNIFEILGVARSEVRLHSAFLANLLDPRGTHGQGKRPLEAFLTMARSRGLQSPDKVPQTGWRIETECFAGKFGRLDLVIHNPRCGFLLAIENKIDAELRQNQLVDYRMWLNTQRLRWSINPQLIFLTPDGRQGGAEDVRLSYHHDIVKWLQSVAVGSPVRLRETILQYQQLVANLILNEANDCLEPQDN